MFICLLVSLLLQFLYLVLDGLVLLVELECPLFEFHLLFTKFVDLILQVLVSVRLIDIVLPFRTATSNSLVVVDILEVPLDAAAAKVRPGRITNWILLLFSLAEVRCLGCLHVFIFVLSK